MKVTLNWLKQYVDVDDSAAALAERLTRLGLEVEGVQAIGGEFDGIVVAQVLSREKHPNADKLSVCRVHDGRGERQIVCGATNFQPGDKVPLILPGACLPFVPGEKPQPIKVGKIRGVESHGMLCSPRELGLAEDASGLMILPPDAPVGQPFAEYLGRGDRDVVFDLEVTPNRPDLNSVIGIAREIAAVTGQPLRLPEIRLTENASPASRLVRVQLEAPDLCPRYTARVIRGVKIGPSPAWLRVLLEKVGLRPINNVVDATNYVMLEWGQPLHAFDYHLLTRDPDGLPTVVVRRARDGELFVTLDGQQHTLSSEYLLIADAEKGIALAGVMGGQNTEINERTVDVLLESAAFAPTNIRRTSKALGLRTDASYRFERGTDIEAVELASRRCAQLILETAGGHLAAGVVDAYPAPLPPRQITLRPAKVNELLGLALPPGQIEYYLGQLGLRRVDRKPRPVEAPAGSTPEPSTWLIPSWRSDLKREADLIEEVCRLHGVDQIPATPPRGAMGTHPHDAIYDQLAEARHLLTGLGLDEAQGQTLVNATAAERLAGPKGFVRLANPLSSDMDALRPSLLPGLLDSLQHNAGRRQGDLALFEIGRVFARAGDAVRETRHLAVALTGRRQPTFWSGAERDALYDLADLKGLIETFLDHFGVRGVGCTPQPAGGAFFFESAALTLGGRVVLGVLGQLAPGLARQHDLPTPVFLAELDLDQLLARRQVIKTFKPLPQFPAIRRDVALLVSESVTHDAVLMAVKQARPLHLEQMELFDVFRGQNVPPGQKSLAYAFTYRAADRTLTDEEVNRAHADLVEHLKHHLPATVREG